MRFPLFVCVGLLVIGFIGVNFWPKLIQRAYLYKLMMENQCIQSIEERWGWWGSGGDFFSPLAIDIKMKDGKRLFLSFIYFPGLKPPFFLNLIDEKVFFVTTYDINTENFGISHGIPIGLIMKEMSIRLDSVDDVIKNYDGILAFVSSFVILKDADNRFYESRAINPIAFDEIEKNGFVHKNQWRILTVEYNRVPNYHLFDYINNYRPHEERFFHRRWYEVSVK
jgi:hypothetical protein